LGVVFIISKQNDRRLEIFSLLVVTLSSAFLPLHHSNTADIIPLDVNVDAEESDEDDEVSVFDKNIDDSEDEDFDDDEEEDNEDADDDFSKSKHEFYDGDAGILKPNFKIAGPSGQMTWIRGCLKYLDASNIIEVIDNRYVPMFGETEYEPIHQYPSIGIGEQLEALEKAVKTGK
ncbi:hypothetical protein S83_032464, partial [Arachis hypogaea]